MSGVSVIRYLLVHSAPLIAVVNANNIKGGVLPLTVLPGISISTIDGIPRKTIAMTEPNRLITERVQVMVQTKSDVPSGYAQMKQILNLVAAALPNTRGTINNVTVECVLPESEGPELIDAALSVNMQSQDYFVKWKRSS